PSSSRSVHHAMSPRCAVILGRDLIEGHATLSRVFWTTLGGTPDMARENDLIVMSDEPHAPVLRGVGQKLGPNERTTPHVQMVGGSKELDREPLLTTRDGRLTAKFRRRTRVLHHQVHLSAGNDRPQHVLERHGAPRCRPRVSAGHRSGPWSRSRRKRSSAPDRAPQPFT